MLQWDRTIEYAELVNYYRGLIRLRKKLPGLCDKSPQAVKRIRSRRIHKEGVVSFLVDNKSQGSCGSWDNLFVIYNAADEDWDIMIPEGSWEILADGRETDCRKAAEKTKKGIRVEAHSGMLLGLCH